MQSLGLDIQKDTGFNEKLVAYMYSLEVQYLVENDMAEDLKDIQEAYDIPEDRAADIVEAACSRYLNQVLNLALRAAKKYDERTAVLFGKQALRYTRFISGKVDADGNMFREADKERLISFLHDETRGMDASEDDRASVERLKEVINITEDYVAPLKGIDGLEGKILPPPDINDDKKKWSWG